MSIRGQQMWDDTALGACALLGHGVCRPALAVRQGDGDTLVAGMQLLGILLPLTLPLTGRACFANRQRGLFQFRSGRGSNAKSPGFGHRARNFMAAMWMRLSIYSALRAVKLAPWRYGAKAEPKCPPRMPKKSDD